MIDVGMCVRETGLFANDERGLGRVKRVGDAPKGLNPNRRIWVVYDDGSDDFYAEDDLAVVEVTMAKKSTPKLPMVQTSDAERAAFTESVVGRLRARISAYHNEYETAVNSTLHEEMLYKSFKDVGVQAEWQRGNHETGKGDVSTESCLGSVEAKGGKLQRPRPNARILTETRVSISGPRMTRYATMEDRIAALQAPTFDTYWATIRNEDERKYFVWVVSAQQLHQAIPALDQWTQTSSAKGKERWEVTVGNFRYSLAQDMSWQLWIKVTDPDTTLGEPYVIDVSHVSW